MTCGVHVIEWANLAAPRHGRGTRSDVILARSDTRVRSAASSLSRENHLLIDTPPQPHYTRATPPIESRPLPEPRHRGGRSMDHLLQRLEALEDEVRIVQRRLRRWRQLAGSVLGLALVCLLQPWAIAAQAPGEGPDRTLWQLVNLWRRVNVLERTLTHVTSVTGAGGLPEVVITGANLRLVNDLRATATTTSPWRERGSQRRIRQYGQCQRHLGLRRAGEHGPRRERHGERWAWEHGQRPYRGHQWGRSEHGQRLHRLCQRRAQPHGSWGLRLGGGPPLRR